MSALEKALQKLQKNVQDTEDLMDKSDIEMARIYDERNFGVRHSLYVLATEKVVEENEDLIRLCELQKELLHELQKSYNIEKYDDQLIEIKKLHRKLAI